MINKVLVLSFVVLVSLAAALLVLAAAPAAGIVVEGVSVPGVTLGDSRAQVEVAYGPPAVCQNLPYYDGRTGLDGICRFDAAYFEILDAPRGTYTLTVDAVRMDDYQFDRDSRILSGSIKAK